MDEEQQEEQQQQQGQEQPIAPAAFTNLNITPAPRRPISTFSLFNRQALERDESISGAVKKNQVAINSINSALVNITGQVVNLSRSLNVVAEKLQESSTLEKLKLQQERQQQQRQADLNSRRGVENSLEKNIQGALFAPIQRIGAKTRFTLARLVLFFNTLLGGFLVMRAIKLISALTSGNKEQLENIKSGILKQLTAVGGIFLAINGGLLLALRSITRLAGFLTQVAVTNLLIRPIQLIFKIARNIATAIALGMSTSGVPPIVNTTNTKNIKNQNRPNPNSPFNVPGIKTNAAINIGLTVADILSGEDTGRAIAGSGGSFASFLFINKIGSMLAKQKNPRIAAFGYGLQAFSGILGEISGRPLGKRGFDLVQQAFGLGSITANDQGDIFTSTIDQVSTNNINVTTVPTSSNMPMSVEGRAALLMFAPPSNPNNPYVLNSFIQYNVLPVT
tara:strand:+ start:1695 stop:3044 length:1350 start_codon:yes stop_codon:yes gene_type:complete